MADKFKPSDDPVLPLGLKRPSKPFNAADYEPKFQSAKKGGNFLTDTVHDVGIGTMRIPGAATGLVDIPLGLAGFDRPASRAAESLGEVTGFQPGKWADEAQQRVYSPERQQADLNVQQAWDEYTKGNQSLGGAIKETLANPRNLAGNVFQSLPGMVAGGAAGKVLSGGSKIAGSLGEGLITAGQQMDQVNPDSDPQKSALTSMAAGLGTGLIGYGGSKAANKLGIIDPDTLLSTGAGATAKQPLSIGKRIGYGAAQEGLFEELPQSMQEQAWQNVAEDKPITEGLAQAGVTGALAGGVMGGGFNIMQPQHETPTATNIPKGPLGSALQTVGINPNDRTNTAYPEQARSNGERNRTDVDDNRRPPNQERQATGPYQGLGAAIGGGVNVESNQAPIQTQSQESILGGAAQVQPTEGTISSTTKKVKSNGTKTTESTPNANETRQEEGLLNPTHITSEGVPVIATDTPNIWFDGQNEIEDNYAQPIREVQNANIPLRNTNADVQGNPRTDSGIATGERRIEGNALDGGNGLSTGRTGADDNGQAGSGDTVDRVALGGENVSNTYQSQAGNDAALQLPAKNENISRKRQDVSKAAENEIPVLANAEENSSNQVLEQQLIKSRLQEKGLTPEQADAVISIKKENPSVDASGIVTGLTEMHRAQSTKINFEEAFSQEQTNETSANSGSVQANNIDEQSKRNGLNKDQYGNKRNSINGSQDGEENNTTNGSDKRDVILPPKAEDYKTASEFHAAKLAYNQQQKVVRSEKAKELERLNGEIKKAESLLQKRQLKGEKAFSPAQAKLDAKLITEAENKLSDLKQQREGVINGQPRTTYTVQPTATKPQPTDRPVSTEGDVKPINYKTYTPSKDASNLFETHTDDDVVQAIKQEQDWQYARQGNAWGVNYWINNFTLDGERYTAFTPKENNGKKTIIVQGEHTIINNQLPIESISKSARTESILGKLKNKDLGLPLETIDHVSTFYGDVVSKKGDAFSTIGMAKVAATKLKNSSQYSVVRFKDGFALRKSEYVKQGFDKSPITNKAVIEKVESKGLKQPVQKSEPLTNDEQNVKPEPNKRKATQKEPIHDQSQNKAPQTPAAEKAVKWEAPTFNFPAYQEIQRQEERRGKPWTQDLYNKYHEAAVALVGANAQLAIDDPNTTRHENRVAASVAILSKKLGLSKAQVARATVASLGHDLGKRGMKSILEKHEKLTPDEFGVIKSHPETTKKIMREMGLSEDIIKTASEHHETTSGGYPAHSDRPDFTSQVVHTADIADSLIGGKDSGHDYPLRFDGKELPRTVKSIVLIMNKMAFAGELNKEVYAAYKKMLMAGEIPHAQKAELERNGDVPWVKVEHNKLLNKEPIKQPSTTAETKAEPVKQADESSKGQAKPKAEPQSQLKQEEKAPDIKHSKSKPSSGSTVEQIRSWLKGNVKKMEQSGKIIIVQSHKDLPKHLQSISENMHEKLLDRTESNTSSIQNTNNLSFADTDFRSNKIIASQLIKQFNNFRDIVLGSSFFKQSDIIPSSYNEAFPDRLPGYTKQLGNIINGDAFIKHGFGGLDIPSRRMVLKLVFSIAGSNNQIRNDIIKFIPINMMNLLGGKKFSPDVLFHDMPVLMNMSAFDINNAIPISVNMATTKLISATAFSATKYFPRLGVSNSTSFRDNVLSTGSARHGSSKVSTLSGTKEVGSRFKPAWFDVKFNGTSGTLNDRHNVTPSSDVVLDKGDASTSSLSPIISRLSRVQGLYEQNQDVVYLVADMITKDSLNPVLFHELLHRSETTDPKVKAAIERFESDLGRRFNAASKGVGTPIEQEAYRRVVAANVPMLNMHEEFRAYMISAYQREPQSFTGRLKKIFDDFVAAIRAFLVRNGLDLGFIKSLTPADLTALSKYGAKVASSKVASSKSVMASAQAQRFYSALKRAFIQAPNQAFSNPEQLKAWINGNSSKYDVKKDEIYWSGLNDWLDAQTGKVSRDDVVSYLEQNGVQVEDVVLGEISDKEKLDSYIQDNDGYVQQNDNGTWEVYWAGRDYPEYEELETKDEAEKTLRNIASEFLEVSNFSVEGKAKHNNSQLTLPGGTGYRELVLTIPTIEKYNESDSTHFGDVGKGKQIAWIRYNTRITADGQKALFLEEVQSQRGASYRTAKNNIAKSVDNDFLGIIDRMKKAGVLEVNCD